MSDSSMRAEYVILDQDGYWHLFKESIHSVEKGILIIDIFLEF
jgi:hypothetical protein